MKLEIHSKNFDKLFINRETKIYSEWQAAESVKSSVTGETEA